MEVGGPYRVRQSMSSHVEHRSYDFADHSMSCLLSPSPNHYMKRIQCIVVNLSYHPGMQSQRIGIGKNWMKILPIPIPNLGYG